MEVAYFVAGLAGIFWGVNESINKNITEVKYSAFSYALIQWYGNIAIYAVPFILWGKFPENPIAYICMLLVVIVINIANVMLIKSYKTEDISNVQILSRASVIMSFICGIVLLHEPLTVFKLAGIVSIFFGIVVIFYKGKKIDLSAGFLFALLSGVFFGFSSYLTKRSLEYFDVISSIFVFNVTSAIITVTIPGALKHVKPILKKHAIKIVFSRFAAAAAAFLIVGSLQKGNISVVNTNYETSFLLSTVFIGILLFKEKSNLGKKIWGVACCIVGIILLNFF